MAITEDQALCKIIIKELGVPADKETSCLEIINKFTEHKKFDQTIDELAKMLGKDKETITKTIAEACIPCEYPEVIKA